MHDNIINRLLRLLRCPLFWIQWKENKKKKDIFEEKLIVLFVNFCMIELDNHLLVLEIKEIRGEKMKIDDHAL